jgi:hypothetical protein
MFKIGDLVRCINPGRYLTLGEHYTVIRVNGYGNPVVMCDRGHEETYFTYRFELVVATERKTYTYTLADGSYAPA